MKKICVLTAAILMAFGLCACGKKIVSSEKEQTSSEPKTESKADTSSEAEDSSTTEDESSEAAIDSSEAPSESEAESSQTEKTLPQTDDSAVYEAEESDLDIVNNSDGTVTIVLADTGLPLADDMIQRYSLHDGMVKKEVTASQRADSAELTYLTFDAESFRDVADNAMSTCKEALDATLTDRPDLYSSITAISYNDEFTDFTISVTNKEDFENNSDKEITADIEKYAAYYHAYAGDDAVTYTFHFIDADGNEFLKDVLAGD